jgi:hypothetical protein
MKHTASANTFSVAVIVLFLMAAPLTAQENTAPAQPANGREQTPGLQQTPDGQTMNSAGEWINCQNRVDTVALGGSTGPTFPNGPGWK